MLCPMGPPMPRPLWAQWDEGVWGSGLSGLGLATTSHLRGPQEGWWVPWQNRQSQGKEGLRWGLSE